MFGTNWSTFVDTCTRMLGCKQSDSAIFANSRANNSDSSFSVKSIIELIQDLIITYISTKFGADWLTLYHTIPTTLTKRPFENIVGKGENAGNQHFSFSYYVFYSSNNKIHCMSHIYFCCLQASVSVYFTSFIYPVKTTSSTRVQI